MAKIFITGITGFLGSNIAAYMITQKHDIAASYRRTSDKDLCASFSSEVLWILQEDGWQDKVSDFNPDIIIHGAWIGVEYADRQNWSTQFRNISLLNDVLIAAKNSNCKKIIALGSQAEYGNFEGSIKEDAALNPTESYGSAKIVCSSLLRQFCELYQIEWYWLRLFSFYGKGESAKWFIPFLVNKIIANQYADLTAGEQKYTYLYAEDLGRAVNAIINSTDKSGIYNISGKSVISLRELAEKIRDYINPEFKLNFGKLPYRANQSMHIQGDVTKFISSFGDFEKSDFNNRLVETIDYIKQN